ncbi:MAG TPA: tRNA-uridine aminocarboxypropyltransferase [Bdellovibrionota bacterium]|nr:tRNA-uridine aminocarboxypropyltransferase [Bdellovibrionota bacterium]
MEQDHATAQPAKNETGREHCPQCLKSQALCICSEIHPLQTRIHVLILQHPQEPDKKLGSARLAHLSLPNSTLKIGLSWRNLEAALGRKAVPAQWAVLYLGSGFARKGHAAAPSLQFVSKKGLPLEPPIPANQITGIVVLDGTWSQAKALWWRNPWLLKLRRAILTPGEKSLYRELRKEPRRECLSTIESIAEALLALGEAKETSLGLKKLFAKLLDRERQRKSQRRPGP